MAPLRPLKQRAAAQVLRKLGFELDRTRKGPHEIYRRKSDGKIVPLPRHPSEDIGRGLLRKIIREIGLSVEEFMKYA